MEESQGATALLGLFEPPTESSPLLEHPKSPKVERKASILSDEASITPKQTNHHRKHRSQGLSTTELPSIQEVQDSPIKDHSSSEPPPKAPWINVTQLKKDTLRELREPSTYVGSFMFLLFQVVFSLTMGATIRRPYGASLLGLISKMAAIGIILGAPVYWLTLRDIPALYPTVDLFVAPFLAQIASTIDSYLHADPDIDESMMDAYFLGTFTWLTAVSLFLSGGLLVLASWIKLVNVGSYLPFPVLCGFFAAVGVLTWSLAFTVDTGMSIGEALRNPQRLPNCLLHHFPSVLIAAGMKYLGPKNPYSIAALVTSTIVMFYVVMLVFGVSREQMIAEHWFWGSDELHYSGPSLGYTTPWPMGWLYAWSMGQVHWGAVYACLETTLALSFLYLMRCSLHGAALKKNVPMMSRVADTSLPVPRMTRQRSIRIPQHRRHFSEVVDIEQILEDGGGGVGDDTMVVSPKPTNASLKDILLQYGHSQFVCGLVGSFGITPSVAAAPTMYTLRAERVAPQIGSVLLLSLFYGTNFQIVGYIPKPAFSSLLVLAFIDMIANWFIKSYFKTREKLEWLVVPAIVLLAFVVGLLQAVVWGIAISTLLFVAAFFRSGVVKYIATGTSIRSTIERPPRVSRWLDTQADAIQVFVLQNYLFFGNASSLLAYVTSLFDEADALPKILILDLTLVTGMDTSAVDAFSDILAVAKRENCKIFFCGVSSRLRDTMQKNGVRPETNPVRSQRRLRFFPDLDTAMGKAEDLLIEMSSFREDLYTPRCVSGGFHTALCHIDEQHQTSYASVLMKLEPHTRVVHIKPGESLYDQEFLERGLFFIEYGILKMERRSDVTHSRGSDTRHLTTAGSFGHNMSLEAAPMFRIARVGPGWVIGSLEVLGGVVSPADAVAVSPCCLHHIDTTSIQELEASDAATVLSLYKLLSFLMSKRQESTIAQLGTLHSIMSARRPVRRISQSGSSVWGSSHKDS